MRPRDNIEEIVKNFDVDVNVRKDQEIFDELRQIQAKSKEAVPGISPIIIWRTLMQSKKTKLAVAAMITIALLVLLQIPDGLLPSAYALNLFFLLYIKILDLI